MLSTFLWGSMAVPRLVALALQGERPSGWSMLFPFLIVLVIFYFLLILPAQRQRKRQQQMLSTLKTGDKVVTSGGIHGTIVGLRGDLVQLRIADQVRIDVSRSAIAGHQRQPEEAPKS